MGRSSKRLLNISIKYAFLSFDLNGDKFFETKICFLVCFSLENRGPWMRL